MALNSILLTTDFSDGAREAYGPAGDLARRFGSELHLVHVAEPLNTALSGISLESCLEELEDAMENEARDLAFEHLQVRPHLLHHRRPQEALRQFEREKKIDLAITATRGCTGVSYFLLGSFAERMVRTSAAPVLVYRQRQGGKDDLELQRILVPIDFTETSRAVLPAVRFLAEHFHPRFTFLTVYEMGPRSVPLYARLRRALRSARANAARGFEELKKSIHGVDAEFEFVEGSPAVEILRRGRELAADLILIGTQGALGYMTQAVAREAPCPVLAVPRAVSNRKVVAGTAAAGAAPGRTGGP